MSDPKSKQVDTPMTAPDATKGAASRSRLIPLAIIAVALVVSLIFLGDVLNFETLRDNREALTEWRDRNYLTAVLAYMGLYVLVVALSLPGGLFMTLGGSFLFGFLPGLVMTVIAATAGATIIFLAAKVGIGDHLYAKLVARADGGTGDGEGGMLKRLESGLRSNQISVLLLMRLVPGVPFFVANLAPAFLGVSLRTYVWTTLVGIVPGTAVFCWIGSGLGSVFDRGETPDLSIFFEWQILGPILALCALTALPIVIKILRPKKDVV